jgi:type II secretory pathway pseudopilin PulG
MTRNELYESINQYAKVFMKARDKDMRELGTLLSEANKRLEETDNQLAEAREQIKILSQAGISENTKPTELVETVKRQNEILQEYVGTILTASSGLSLAQSSWSKWRTDIRRLETAGCAGSGQWISSLCLRSTTMVSMKRLTR